MCVAANHQLSSFMWMLQNCKDIYLTRNLISVAAVFLFLTLPLWTDCASVLICCMLAIV